MLEYFLMFSLYVCAFCFLMVLNLDEAFDLILFQIQQVLLTAVTTVGSYRLQCISKRIPAFF